MKKICMILMAVLTVSAVYGKTLRINNQAGNAAPYASVDAALADAVDGDVIILEKSTASYGEVVLEKAVTLQGEGYFLDVNTPSNEGYEASCVYSIKVKSPNVKISSLYVSQDVLIYTDKVVVTRCNLRGVELRGDFATGKIPCSDCIIHQNYIRSGIVSKSYPDKAHEIQISNNIFNSSGTDEIYNLTNSTISRNTFFRQYGAITSVKNSTVEYNINGTLNMGGSDSSTLRNNVTIDIPASSFNTDKELNNAVQTSGVNAGAFSGDDPYVLSGMPRGVRVTDLDMPQSVEQGSDLQITVKVATRR